MLRAVIVDDTDEIRAKNTALIKEYCPTVSILAEASDVKSGIEVITRYMPDLVFLDVEMPDGTGFDLLQQLKPITFKVIFITGFQDFAIKAFRFSAIDYLLKPIDPADLIDAVKKAEETISKEFLDLKFGNLLGTIEQPQKPQKLILKTLDKLFSVKIQDIIYCESDKNYTTFHFVNTTKIIVSTTLKEYETLLVPFGFFRAHQSYLINMSYFDHFVKTDGGIIVMKNCANIPLATRRKEEFFSIIEKI